MQWSWRKGSSSGDSSKHNLGGHARSARIARWLLILPLLMLMAVCPSQGHTQTRPIRGPFTFMYVKSGGFAGIYEELLVDSLTQQLRFRDREGRTQSGRVTRAEVGALRDALNDANFLSLRGPFECGSCADQFEFDGTLRSLQGSNSVHWEDFSDAPPTLFRVNALLDQWIRDRFVR